MNTTVQNAVVRNTFSFVKKLTLLFRMHPFFFFVTYYSLKNPAKNVSWFPQTILCSTTAFNIDNSKKHYSNF